MDQFQFLQYNYNRQEQEENLPPGFRFHPTDEELITHYLLKKVLDGSFTSRAIPQVDLNKCEPWDLPEKAKMGEKERYYFSLRDRKYPTGLRTNRATESGYWKATGKDREIYSSKTRALVGMKKTLVFYRGRAPKGLKTNWVMHEYRLDGKFSYHYLSRSSKDEWVISRVFQKSPTGAAASSVSKKGRFNGGILLYPEVNSQASSASQLPPLLDSTASTAPITNYETVTGNVSYNSGSSNKTEHVSCFSTFSNFINPNGQFELPPPTVNHVGLPVFPSLRSLQENLQQPLFGNGTVTPPMQRGGDQMGSFDVFASWGGGGGGTDGGTGGGRVGLGGTELDCLWSF